MSIICDWLYVILDHFCIVWNVAFCRVLSIFCIDAAALIILLILFGHPNVTAIQMSRSNLLILSFVFQSLASGFIVRSYFIVNWRDFFMAWIWPDYRQVSRSECHDDTRSAQFSLALSRSCQLNYRHDLSRSSLAR